MLIEMTIDYIKNEYQKSALISIVLVNNTTLVGNVVEHDSFIHILNPMVLDITINEENNIIPFLRHFNLASAERFAKIDKQHIITANRISESVKTLYTEYLKDELVKSTKRSDYNVEGMTKH